MSIVRPAFASPSDALRYHVSGPGGADKQAVTVDALAAAHARAASDKRYTVKTIEAWTKPGASSVAIHCVPPAGFVRTVQGFRVIRPDGSTLYSSQPPFSTQGEAQAVADGLNAPDLPPVRPADPTPPVAPAPADVPGYVVTVADHETGAKATRHALTAAIAAKMLGLPADDVARIEADKWGFFMPFDASASATIVRIGGLTYEAGNPSAGQRTYDVDCCHSPTYPDGLPRPAWEALCPAIRNNWDRHPTPPPLATPAPFIP